MIHVTIKNVTKAKLRELWDQFPDGSTDITAFNVLLPNMQKLDEFLNFVYNRIATDTEEINFYYHTGHMTLFINK